MYLYLRISATQSEHRMQNSHKLLSSIFSGSICSLFDRYTHIMQVSVLFLEAFLIARKVDCNVVLYEALGASPDDFITF